MSTTPFPFTQVDQHGRVVNSGLTMAYPPGEGLTNIPELAPEGHYRSQDSWVPLPPQPSSAHVFDWPTHTWVDPRTLDDLRATQWSQIKQDRDAAEAAGFWYMGRLIDSDARSVQRITGAVQAAQKALETGEPFTISWTCADNSLLELDAEQMTGMPAALALYVNGLHEKARGLRAAIASAANASAIQSITWDSVP